MFGLFKKSTSNWQGKTGRISTQVVTTYLDDNMPHGPESDCLYYICGPGNLADLVKEALVRGINAKQIHTELFVNAGHVPGEFSSASGTGGKRVIAHLKGQRIELPVPDGATILDVLVKAKYDPPYSYGRCLLHLYGQGD